MLSSWFTVYQYSGRRPERGSHLTFTNQIIGFSRGSMAKNPPASVEDVDSVPDPGRSSGGENGNPLQCSCLENPIKRGAWWAVVHGVTRSQTRLNN